MKSDTARVLLAVVLVAGAGPAGFLMYRLVFAGRMPPPAAASAPRTPAPAGTPVPGASSAPTSAAPAAASGPAGGSSPGAPRPAAPDPAPGTSGAAPQDSVPARSLPKSLPQVALPDDRGTRHRLADYRGHPLVLNFWATWCEPCRREIPLLKSLYHTHPGLQVVGVAMDFTADVRRFARDLGIDYPLLMGEDDGLAAVDALGMQTAFPFTVFADSRGDIVAVKRGELHADEARLILERITAVDGGLAVDEGRRQISDGLRDLAVQRARSITTPRA